MLDFQLSQLRKPYVVIMDGITSQYCFDSPKGVEFEYPKMHR